MGKPRNSSATPKAEHWYEKGTVQAAIVLGALGLIGVILTVTFDRKDDTPPQPEREFFLDFGEVHDKSPSSNDEAKQPGEAEPPQATDLETTHSGKDIDLTTAEIAKRLSAYPPIQAQETFDELYKGGKVRWQGKVTSVQKVETLKGVFYLVGFETRPDPSGIRNVSAVFDAENRKQILDLRSGEFVLVRGVLDDVSASGDFYLVECKLLKRWNEPGEESEPNK